MDTHDSTFSQAVRAVIDGDATRLRELLRETPELASARSGAPHHATLLHYVAANGVEDELQRTPANAVEICSALLEAGADPDAHNAAQGGNVDQTPLCLLVSSWHPFERGVQTDLVRTLVAGGANPNGVNDNGAPLATALVFGYTGAAEALADVGARADNLLFAAGLGRVADVEAYFEGDGALRPGALGKYQPPVPRTLSEKPDDIVQEAFHFAVTHSRRDVAARLLERGADVNGHCVGHHCELPLLQALFVREFALVPWLLERGARPDLRDGKRGTTALEHARSNAPARVIELLENVV